MEALFSWLVGGRLFAVFSHGTEKKRQSYGLSSFLIRTLILSKLGSHPYDTLNLNYLLKALSPNTVTLGVRASTYQCGRGHNLVHTIIFIIAPLSQISK